MAHLYGPWTEPPTGTATDPIAIGLSTAFYGCLPLLSEELRVAIMQMT